MPRIEVQQFTRRNLKRIVEIEQGSFGKDAWPEEAFLEYWRESPELFLVARHGRRVAGYSITRTGLAGAELDSIAVDPCYRGQGVAHALLDATVSALESGGRTTLRLMVSTRNEPALRFYRQHGFTRSRLVKRYYGAGRDAWRMSLKIAPKAAASGPKQ